MPKRFHALLALALLLSTTVSLALAEERIIEEEIIVTDPTVAAEKKWVAGGSYELWYVAGDFDRVDNSGNTVASGSIDGVMNGGNLFIGYDNFTFQYSLRKADWDLDLHYDSNGIDTVTDWTRTEHELTARYLSKKELGFFFPYVIAGYNRLSQEKTETITTAGWFWTATGTPTRSHEDTFDSLLLGIGGIAPINQYVGIRADGRLLFSHAERTYSNGTSETGSGVGGAGILTGYWNIYKGLNLQAGGKYQYTNGGSDIWDSLGGGFAMLGYSQRF